jgi:hypothetical protein
VEDDSAAPLRHRGIGLGDDAHSRLGEPRERTTASSGVLGDDAITVGSFDFHGSILLADVYNQALEASGYRMHRRSSWAYASSSGRL